MPTYVYACTECGHQFEAVQSFSDDSLTECPECTGRLRKVFNSVGIVFKGSGFYRTDSADKSSSSTAAKSSGSDSSSGSSENSAASSSSATASSDSGSGSSNSTSSSSGASVGSSS